MELLYPAGPFTIFYFSNFKFSVKKRIVYKQEAFCSYHHCSFPNKDYLGISFNDSFPPI